jgi:hypothetical protein
MCGKKDLGKYGISRGGSLVDAINARALATGSMRGAMAGHSADYNGHFIRVDWNSYKGYWLAEYTWAGRNVLARGSFEQCLDAALEEHARGASFSTVVTYPETVAQAAYARQKGLSLEAKESKADPMFALVGDAMHLQDQFGVPATTYLLQSKTPEEYKAKVDADFESQRERRLAHATAHSAKVTAQIERAGL